MIQNAIISAQERKREKKFNIPSYRLPGAWRIELTSRRRRNPTHTIARPSTHKPQRESTRINIEALPSKAHTRRRHPIARHTPHPTLSLNLLRARHVPIKRRHARLIAQHQRRPRIDNRRRRARHLRRRGVVRHERERVHLDLPVALLGDVSVGDVAAVERIVRPAEEELGVGGGEFEAEDGGVELPG